MYTHIYPLSLDPPSCPSLIHPSRSSQTAMLGSLCYIAAFHWLSVLHMECSCLENHMERGTWWATVHRVAKSQTRLKQLSRHTHVYICQCHCLSLSPLLPAPIYKAILYISISIPALKTGASVPLYASIDNIYFSSL